MKILRLFSIVVLISFFISGCSGNQGSLEEDAKGEAAISSDVTTENNVDEQVLTFALSGTEKGVKKWDLEGESADILDNNIIELTNVKGKIYSEDSVVTITADKGKFNKGNSNVELRENVVVVTEDGAELKSEHLNWDSPGERIWTDDFVEIQRDEIKVTGYGILGWPNLEKVKIKRNVRIDIEPSTVITCDGLLKIDYKKSVAYLEKNVQVTDERGELNADKARVYFDKTNKSITKIIAEKNVVIKRDNNITYSHEAIYYADERKVILTGKPRFIAYIKNEEEKNGISTDKKSDKEL